MKPRPLSDGYVPNYDRFPTVKAGSATEVARGSDAIAGRISGSTVTVIECYPGVGGLDELVSRLNADVVIDAASCLLGEDQIRELTAPYLGDDLVFGYLSDLRLEEFFDDGRLSEARAAVAAASGRVVVHGTGASLIADSGQLIYAGLPRWEATLRQRAGTCGLGVADSDERSSHRYKRTFFIDWRVADRHRRELWDHIDLYLDSTDTSDPKLISAATWYKALKTTSLRPFRVVPYFDPAPWGGHWMQEVCDVGRDRPNLGWCFDCVPEENSLLLDFGGVRVEVPSIDLVFREPESLLGSHVWKRFGEEFPIRFDFLDTIGGGNLSLQVHPLTSYIREKFNITYTQDESYYILDAVDGATVYLGVKTGVDRDQMVADLHRAQTDPNFSFPAETHVNRFDVTRHDHVLIPAGTVHCSGAGSMVLEISATPYIFTFKLWDWDRLGLDGLPRPIHLDHGVANIQWNRDTEWVKSELINTVQQVGSGDGWREERTGLHSAEFIETRRHWFTKPVSRNTNRTVQVCNLIEGREARIVSPSEAFEPVTVHYAETFIVPAAVGPYEVHPMDDDTCGLITASVRPEA